MTVENWEAWNKVKRTAVEWLAVFIASFGALVSTLISLAAVILAGVAIYIAYNAAEQAAINDIRSAKNEAAIRESRQ